MNVIIDRHGIRHLYRLRGVGDAHTPLCKEDQFCWVYSGDYTGPLDVVKDCPECDKRMQPNNKRSH